MSIFFTLKIASSETHPRSPQRSSQSVNDIIEKAILGKRLVPLTEAVAKATVPKIPKRKVYKKYRRQLRTYLREVDEYNSRRGGCYAKTFDLLGKFAIILERYTAANAPPEARDMENLWKQSGGNEIASDWSRYKALNYSASFQNMNADDIRLLTPHLQEIC